MKFGVAKLSQPPLPRRGYANLQVDPVSGYGRLEDYSANTDGHVDVIFRDHKNTLIKRIEEAASRGLWIFGAIAWVTDTDILTAMALTTTHLVVQKEDFLRPDVPYGGRNRSRTWEQGLRTAYEGLAPSLRADMPEPIPSLSEAPLIEGIRCVGVQSQDRSAHDPRMHHKFLVFVEVERVLDGVIYVPESVWTGSFNLTEMSTRSLENAVMIRDGEIAGRYLQEWSQIMAISETLDWESEWVAPTLG